jgi:hypothetical protein
MTAPTEEEIRAAVDKKLREFYLDAESAITAGTCDMLGLYDTPELRQSELDDWDELMHPVRPSVLLATLMEQLRVYLTDAAVGYARAHPDAPRAVREPVTA